MARPEVGGDLGGQMRVSQGAIVGSPYRGECAQIGRKQSALCPRSVGVKFPSPFTCERRCLLRFVGRSGA